MCSHCYAFKECVFVDSINGYPRFKGVGNLQLHDLQISCNTLIRISGYRSISTYDTTRWHVIMTSTLAYWNEAWNVIISVLLCLWPSPPLYFLCLYCYCDYRSVFLTSSTRRQCIPGMKYCTIAVADLMLVGLRWWLGMLPWHCFIEITHTNSKMGASRIGSDNNQLVCC